MTYEFEKLDFIDRQKVESIINFELTNGMIKDLDSLKSLIDNLIINDNLDTYTTDGFKKLIHNIRINPIDKNEIIVTLQNDFSEDFEITMDYTLTDPINELYDTYGIDLEFSEEWESFLKDLLKLN